MAANREKRSNAGARMTKLIEAEDDDDFYKTTYGGFTEEADDNDYQTEESASDVTDSDIDIDENDEIRSDIEDAGDDSKRQKHQSSKAYKEPKKATTDESASSVPKPRPKIERAKPEKPAIFEASFVVRTSLRKSTADKTRSTEDTMREREARAAMLRQIADKKRVPEVRRLTQEELLAEARITEKINLRSLATYQKLELEKKKSRVHRQVHLGPYIRYHSVTVPVVDETATETEINVDTDTVDSGEQAKTARLQLCTEKCSRTYITFAGDTSLYRRFFPQRRPPRSFSRSTCPITGLPAVYFDPLTQIPYATVDAFRIIREAYKQQHADTASSKRSETVESSNRKV